MIGTSLVIPCGTCERCPSESRNVKSRVSELLGGSNSLCDVRKYSKGKREIMKNDIVKRKKKFNPFPDSSKDPEPIQMYRTEGWRIDSTEKIVQLSFNREERDVSFLKKALSNYVEISKVIFCKRVAHVDGNGVVEDFFLFGVEISGSYVKISYLSLSVSNRLSASSTMGISSVKRGFERRILILEKKIQSIDTDIIRLISQRKIEEKKEEPGEGVLIRLTECINQKKNMKVPLGEEYMQLEKYIETNTFRLEAKILVYKDKHAMLFEWGDTFKVYCGYTPNDETDLVTKKPGSPEYCVVKRRRMKSFRRGSRIVERMKQETFLVYKARKKINITNLILEEKEHMHLVPRVIRKNGLTKVSVEEQIVMRGNKFVMFGPLILYKGELIVDESWSRIYVPDAVLKSIPLTSKFFLRCCKTQALDNDNLVKYLLAERRNEMWLPSKSSIFPTEHNNWMLYLLLCHDNSTNEFASISADVFTYSILPFLHVNHVFWILPSDLRRQERTFYFREQLQYQHNEFVPSDEVISTVAESYTGEILSMIYDHFDQTSADFDFLDRCRLISIVHAYDRIFEYKSSEWMSEMLSFLSLFLRRATSPHNPMHCGANSCRKGCGPIDRDAPRWATMHYSEWEKLIVFSFSVSNCCHRKMKDCSRSPYSSDVFYQFLDLLCDVVTFWETVCDNRRSFRLFGKMLIELDGLKGATEFFWGKTMRFYSRIARRRRINKNINSNLLQRWYKVKFFELFSHWMVHWDEVLRLNTWTFLKLVLQGCGKEEIIKTIFLHLSNKTVFSALSSLNLLPLSEKSISERIPDFPIITTKLTEDLSPVEVIVMLLLCRCAASGGNMDGMYGIINDCFQWDSPELGCKMIQAVIDSQKRLKGILNRFVTKKVARNFRTIPCFMYSRISGLDVSSDAQLRKWLVKTINLSLYYLPSNNHYQPPVFAPKIVLHHTFFVVVAKQARSMLQQTRSMVFPLASPNLQGHLHAVPSGKGLPSSRSDIRFIIAVMKLIRSGLHLNRYYCSRDMFTDLLRDFMVLVKIISNSFHSFSKKEIKVLDAFFSETPRFIVNTSLLLDDPEIFREYTQSLLNIWCSICLDRVFLHESCGRLCSIIRRIAQWLWTYFPVFSSTEFRNDYFQYTLSIDDYDPASVRYKRDKSQKYHHQTVRLGPHARKHPRPPRPPNPEAIHQTARLGPHARKHPRPPRPPNPEAIHQTARRGTGHPQPVQQRLPVVPEAAEFPTFDDSKAKIPSHPEFDDYSYEYSHYFVNGFPKLDFLRYAAVDILSLDDTPFDQRTERILNFATKLIRSFEIPGGIDGDYYSYTDSFYLLFFKILSLVRITRPGQRRKLLVEMETEKFYEKVFGKLVHSCSHLLNSHEECEICSMFSLASHELFPLERDNHFLFESTVVYIDVVIQRALNLKLEGEDEMRMMPSVSSFEVFDRCVGFRSFSWVLTFTDLLSSRYSSSTIANSFSPETKFKFQEVVDLMLRCVKVNPNEKYEVVLWKFLREAVANVSNLKHKFAERFISIEEYDNVSDLLKFQCKPIMEIIRARVDVLLSSPHPTEDEDSVSDSLAKAFMVLLAVIVRIQSFMHPVREFNKRKDALEKLFKGEFFAKFEFITARGSYNKEKVSAIEEKDFNEMCDFDYVLDLYSRKRMKTFHSPDDEDFRNMLKYFNSVAYACWSLSYRFADKFFEFWISIARLTVDPNCGFIETVPYSLIGIDAMGCQLSNIILHSKVDLEGHDSYERIFRKVVQLYSEATVDLFAKIYIGERKYDRILKLITLILSSKSFAGTRLSSELWKLVREKFDCQAILRSHELHKEIMEEAVFKHLESGFIDITGELLTRMKALKKLGGDEDHSFPPRPQQFVKPKEEEEPKKEEGGGGKKSPPPFLFEEASESPFVIQESQTSNSSEEPLNMRRMPWDMKEVDLNQEFGGFDVTSGKEGKKKKDNKPKFLIMDEHFVEADPAENSSKVPSSKGLDFGDLASSFDSMIAPQKEEGDPIVDTKGQDATSEVKENESNLDENFSFGSLEFNFDSSQSSKSTNMDLDFSSMNFDSIGEIGAFGAVGEEVSGSADVEESKHPEAKGE